MCFIFKILTFFSFFVSIVLNWVLFFEILTKNYLKNLVIHWLCYNRIVLFLIIQINLIKIISFQKESLSI
jgi:hypothetical protein